MYCTKCGTENLDDASACVNCGSSLNIQPVRKRRNDWDMEDNCFGGRDRSSGPIFFGVIIILFGLSSLLERTYSWARFDNLWPVIIIAIGLMVVYNAMKR